MTLKLFFSALLKLALGLLLVGVFLFLPVGSFSYPHAWLFLASLGLSMVFVGGVLFLKNPALLKKRLHGKEKLKKQGVVVKLSGLMFVTGFVVAGLDFRFGWSHLSKIVSVIFVGVFFLSFALYAVVLRENPYLSRTIETQEDQKVIDTGLYRVVRHPMYSVTLLLFLSIPLVLGSIYALAVFLAYPFLIAARIKSEEAFLEKELKGYSEYKEKVKYRLIPFIW